MHINLQLHAFDHQADLLLCFGADVERKTMEKTNHLTDDDILDSVAELPVAKLMTKDCKDLWVVASLFLVL